MLVGYNTNVKFKGNVYHVQTEDSGLTNPIIITLLYIKGTILSSKKVSYEHMANSPDYKETVRELMKKQHKSMIKELISGKYTAGDTPEAPDEPSTLEKTKKPQQESQTKCKITKSLDDVLLDYIIKKEDQ
jgi:hypothetical protein